MHSQTSFALYVNSVLSIPISKCCVLKTIFLKINRRHTVFCFLCGGKFPNIDTTLSNCAGSHAAILSIPREQLHLRICPWTNPSNIFYIFVIFKGIFPTSVFKSTFYLVISVNAVAVLMSLIFMSLSIGSKRLATAIIPQGTVINDVTLQKYLKNKKASNYSFEKSSCGNDLSSPAILFSLHSTNMC